MKNHMNKILKDNYQKNAIEQVWDNQHPTMRLWMVSSSISIASIYFISMMTF